MAHYQSANQRENPGKSFVKSEIYLNLLLHFGFIVTINLSNIKKNHSLSKIEKIKNILTCNIQIYVTSLGNNY